MTLCSVAIDPGGTTGVAVRARTGELVTFTLPTQTKEGHKYVFHPKLLSQLLTTPGIDRVVYEDFGAETISGFGLHTVRMCGLIIGVCDVLNIQCVRHMPMDRKPYLSDARELLKGKGVVIHEIDAAAHLLKLESTHGQ